jgi:hypothetical protein
MSHNPMGLQPVTGIAGTVTLLLTTAYIEPIGNGHSVRPSLAHHIFLYRHLGHMHKEVV